MTMGIRFNFRNGMRFWVKLDILWKNKSIVAPQAALIENDYILGKITNTFSSLQ